MTMEACLPPDKLNSLRDILLDWHVCRHCTLWELQELIGFLKFCMQVIPHACTFIHGLINFSMTFTSNISKRHVPTYAHSDMHWWSVYAWSWNGVQILKPAWATLHIYTDASGAKGLGGVFGDSWFSSRCPCWFCLRDIQLCGTTSHPEVGVKIDYIECN